MTFQENMPHENTEAKKEKLLPKEIRDGLNELRNSEMSYHDKAERFALLLEKNDCQNIEVLDCDVCITDFYPEFFNKLSEIYPENFDKLSPEEQQKVHDKMDLFIPQEAKVRVHAETKAGYLTYCFACDNTMCANEVDYPEDADWNKLHKAKAKKILLSHADWPISAFNLCGSTRNRICMDVISDDPEFKFHMFNMGETHISIIPVDDTILKNIPQIKEQFETLKP